MTARNQSSLTKYLYGIILFSLFHIHTSSKDILKLLISVPNLQNMNELSGMEKGLIEVACFSLLQMKGKSCSGNHICPPYVLAPYKYFLYSNSTILQGKKRFKMHCIFLRGVPWEILIHWHLPPLNWFHMHLIQKFTLIFFFFLLYCPKCHLKFGDKKLTKLSICSVRLHSLQSHKEKDG